MKIIFFPFLIFLNSTKYLSYCIPVEYLWKLLLVSVISIAPLIQTSLDETYLSYKLRKAWQNIQLNFLSITQSSKCLLLWVCQKKRKLRVWGKKFKKFPFTTLFLLSGVSPGFTDPMDFPWKRAKEWNNRVGAFAGFFGGFVWKRGLGSCGTYSEGVKLSENFCFCHTQCTSFVFHHEKIKHILAIHCSHISNIWKCYVNSRVRSFHTPNSKLNSIRWCLYDTRC